jgi:cell division protein FtsL
VGFAIAAAVLLGPMLLGIAGMNALLAQQSFHLDALERHIASLATEHQELVHERARLSAPGRIAAWARRMGMRLPDDIRPLHTPGEDQAAPAGSAGGAGGGA